MEEVCLFKSNLFSNFEIINKTFFCENKEEKFCGHVSDFFLCKKAFFFFIEIVSIINLSCLFHILLIFSQEAMKRISRHMTIVTP